MNLKSIMVRVPVALFEAVHAKAEAERVGISFATRALLQGWIEGEIKIRATQNGKRKRNDHRKHTPPENNRTL